MRLVTFSVLFVTGGMFCLGQSSDILLNARTPDEAKSKVNIVKEGDYMPDIPPVNDQDIMWSKSVWEIIDLNQKMNFHLYFPTDTLNVVSSRRSLFYVLMKGIRTGDIESVYSDSYFNQKITYDDILESITKVDTLDAGYDQLNAGEAVSPEYITKVTISTSDIRQIRVRGIWYFDRRGSVLKYRVIGIAPVSRDVNFLDDSGRGLVELFWVWYRDARELLYKSKVYNPKNPAIYITFDQIFNSRRFSGVIYKDDNIYNDRKISDYTKENAYLQLMEAQRIKEKIRNTEEDMWVY